MRKPRYAIAIVATLIASSVVLTRGQDPVRAQSSTHAHGVTSSDAFSHAMERSMTRMMTDMHAASATGNPDIDFLAMMIPHHEGAVEMSRLVLEHGRDPLARKLAEEIIAGQIVEIAAMRERLARLTRGVRAEQEYPNLSGTRGSH